MFRTKKLARMALALLVLFVIAIPLASFAAANLPSLFAPLTGADSATVFVGVAGAFGAGYVIAVPRERNKPH
jgi:hypothetical protein